MVNIVNVSVSQQVASAPSQLQSTGAFISQGGTTLAAGTSALITQVSDLTALVNPAISITSISWAGSVATVTTQTPHLVPIGDTLQGVISGAVPSGYDGTFAVTATGASTLTYPLATNPGSETVAGKFQIYSAVEIQAMADTFFAQDANQAVYVLELGANTVANGVASLSTYIAAPSLQFYGYLLPASWDGNSAMHALATQYNGPTAEVYFYTTTTIATASFWAGIKSVVGGLLNPAAPVTEFSLAALFQVMLSRNPGVSNQAAPVSFTYVYGVTPLVLTGPQQVTMKALGVNWIGTGAEGGISNTIIFWGTTMDLNPLNYWYAVDWADINVHMALAATIINGSNNPTNPL